VCLVRVVNMNCDRWMFSSVVFLQLEIIVKVEVAFMTFDSQFIHFVLVCGIIVGGFLIMLKQSFVCFVNTCFGMFWSYIVQSTLSSRKFLSQQLLQIR